MTDQELKEIRERLEAATPGPWFVSDNGFTKRGDGPPTVYAPDDELRYIAVCNDGFNINPTPNLSNAQFIAHAPNDIRRLLDEVERLRKEISAYEYLQSEIDRIVGELEKQREEAKRLTGSAKSTFASGVYAATTVASEKIIDSLKGLMHE
jgi:hypothetical protein